MAAELAHVEGTVARWCFAAGCIRVALSTRRAWRRGPTAWLAITAGMVLLAPLALAPRSASARLAWATGNLLACITVYGLYLAALITTAGRPVPSVSTGGERTATALRWVILAGVAGAAALDAFVLIRYPEVRSQGNAGWSGYLATVVVTIVVAIILGAYIWLAVARVDGESRDGSFACRYGLAAGTFAGLMFVVASYVPVPGVLVVAGAGICSAFTGHLASRATGSARTGLATGVRAGVIAGLALFVLGTGLTLTTGGPSPSATTIADFHASTFHDLRSFLVAGMFGLDGDPPLLGALIPLIFVPLFCAGLSAFGATRGNSGAGQRNPQAHPTQP